MSVSHKIARFVKQLAYPDGEPYMFKNKKLRFNVGSRPIRRKYIHSANDIVRNDVLQIEYFEKHFNPDNVLWDIGSHHGHYSIFAASVAKGANQVFSFEPDVEARKAQLANILLNKLEQKISVFDHAVSHADKEELFNAQGGNANSRIIKNTSAVNRGDVIAVTARSLNSLLYELPKPDFIKIDTEGAEIDILNGADQALDMKEITFICELHPFAWEAFNVKFEDFLGSINKHGRRLSLLDSKKKLTELPYYGTVVF